ncbi:hypothetical protein WRSd3_03645 [Shigella dysenteriae WRSd3]|uniref:Uncharacterized protein n=1 Tax=Shigella dysenteriae WRSd3 TaxID=1401327 RepID=A0A090NCV6_SHIDY|nr:hypothetical protein WRSd3_03645 [Shigella dysenteriae WRSd3]ESU83820.1 hypothetical protein WRSd5_01361 [Shigella dysenteriae WRSd5]
MKENLFPFSVFCGDTMQHRRRDVFHLAHGSSW